LSAGLIDCRPFAPRAFTISLQAVLRDAVPNGASLTPDPGCIIKDSSGLMAVARYIQGISPKHCTSPARRAEGFWRNVRSPKAFHPAAALETAMSNVAFFGFSAA
jgi:hypothetical protein